MKNCNWGGWIVYYLKSELKKGEKISFGLYFKVMHFNFMREKLLLFVKLVMHWRKLKIFKRAWKMFQLKKTQLDSKIKLKEVTVYIS